MKNFFCLIVVSCFSYTVVSQAPVQSIRRSRGLSHQPNGIHSIHREPHNASSRSGTVGLLLHTAAKTGDLASVDLLIRNGAHPDAVDMNGQTPLHLAVNRGYVDVVSCLLRLAASPHATDNDGRTPLHLAAQNGDYRICQRLLAAHALVEVVDNHGNTPLFYASNCVNEGSIERGNEALCSLLVNWPDLTSRAVAGVGLQRSLTKSTQEALDAYYVIALVQRENQNLSPRHLSENQSRAVSSSRSSQPQSSVSRVHSRQVNQEINSLARRQQNIERQQQEEADYYIAQALQDALYNEAVLELDEPHDDSSESVEQELQVNECPVCMENDVEFSTPCCRQGVCDSCWDNSVSSHPDGCCPFCRATENQRRHMDGL